MPSRPVLAPLLALLCAGALLATAGGCDRIAELATGPDVRDTTRAPGVPPLGHGLVTVATAQSVPAATQALKGALQSSGASLVAEVNHTANAGGDSLRPTRLLLFDLPGGDMPMMQSVRSTGLDLPQKMLVWRGADDSTRITYNAPEYLRTRHEFRGVSLRSTEQALAGLAEQAAGRTPDTSAFNADSVGGGAGLVLKASDHGPRETYRRLRSALQSRAGLSIMTEVTYAGGGPAAPSDSAASDTAATASRGSGLPFTRLLVFGNPAAGTPLMRRAPTMGLDLPQKMLVYETGENNTFVAYNAPAYLARRHVLGDTTGLAPIRRALDALAFEATASEAERRQRQQARQDTTGSALGL